MSPISRTRAELIEDLRALADTLAADEAIPFNESTASFQHHVFADTDAAGVHRLHEIAAVLGVDPFTTAEGLHHHARVAVGGLTYDAVYVERQSMDNYAENSRIIKAHRAGECPPSRLEPDPEREETLRVEEDAAELDSYRREGAAEIEAERRTPTDDEMDAAIVALAQHLDQHPDDAVHPVDCEHPWHYVSTPDHEPTAPTCPACGDHAEATVIL